MKNTQKETRKYKKENGICRYCTEKTCDASKIYCKKHLESTREYNKKWAKEHPENTKKTQNKSRKNKIDNEKCVSCGNPVLPRITSCKICVLKRLSYNHLGTATRWKELDDKLNACNNICFHTGYPVSLEDGTASIDHLKPISTHPELINNIDNLVWCHISFNFAKNNRSEEEFVPYFYKVAKSFIKKQETIEEAPDSFDI